MRSASVVFLVAAACGGGQSTPVPTLPAETAQVAASSSTIDPHLAARRVYSNPGGMWMPQQMTLPGHAQTFAALGVKIDPATLADPLSSPLAAIVRLNGCSASFVSPEGLVVTNHHCVQGALQVNSKTENNLVEHGFLAKTRANEPSAGPAERIFVAQAFTDVTSAVRDGLDKIADPIARKDEVDRRTKQLVATCEKGRAEVRCNVAAYFRRGTYILIEELEIRDVRLVYAPARSIGNYGGEVDNWQWPRHTGDFSFYRAYVGKDGKPADFAPDNVPFRPKHFLKVSDQGLVPSDFVMITGFPGRTTRAKTASEVKHDVEWYYPYIIELQKQRYAIAEAGLAAKGETAIKAGVLKQRVQNVLQKMTGVLAGLTSGDLVQRKVALDDQVHAWVKQPGHETQAAAIAKLEELIAAEQRTAQADAERNFTFFGSSQLLANAITFLRWADERQKPDDARKPGFQQRDMQPAVSGQKQLTKQYDASLDRAQLRLALVRSLALPAEQRAWLPLLLGVAPRAKLDEALIDKTLDGWYRTSKLADEKLRLELLQSTTAKLAASKDPFVRAASRVWKTYKAEEKLSDIATGDALLVGNVYVEAMRDVLGGLLAPDANSTLRITYGTVKAFKANEPAFTNATQILAKDTGTDPFDAPKALLDAVRAKKFGPYANAAGELPVDFLSDLDTTGGNSGSAVLNDRGELVGLNFDSTLQGVAADVVFDGTTVRKIHVDVRYMLWVMDAIDNADHLITEMGLTPRI